MINILIFKTNLDSPELLSLAEPVIRNLDGVCRWNVDMQDCDNVLRIEAFGLTAGSVERVLTKAGYYCEELQD